MHLLVRSYFFNFYKVCLSIIDVFVSYLPTAQFSSGKGAISAFRAFRLIRIFKLVKSWKQLQVLIQTIAQSLIDISSFLVLLFLLIFVYVLLGMEIFSDNTVDVNTPATRLNFNSFYASFLVVFEVLTLENYD